MQLPHLDETSAFILRVEEIISIHQTTRNHIPENMSLHSHLSQILQSICLKFCVRISLNEISYEIVSDKRYN
jgi:hypothetical protein